jgi:acetylglutamate kinase
MMEELYVIKIGGNIIDEEEKLRAFLKTFAGIRAKKILVHGGGKLATSVAHSLGVKQEMVNGRRITDAATLKVVTMVYAGYINKNIVAQLHGFRCNAIGLSGADGNLIQAHKRTQSGTDFGFAGDLDAVNNELLQQLLQQQLTPVCCPITHDRKGQLLNTNADTIAQSIAVALGRLFQVTLAYSFEKAGVLLDVDDETSVINRLTPGYYSELKEQQLIFAGMIPKLDNAFTAIREGVSKVVIGKAESLDQMISGSSGTTIVTA